MSIANNQDDIVRRPGRDDVKTGLRLAEDFLRVGDSQRAAEAYAHVAEVFVKRGDVMQAVAVCFRALQVEPAAFASVVGDSVLSQLGPSGRPLLERAVIGHEENENWSGAAEIVRRLIQADPSSVALRVRLGDLLRRAGRREEAVDVLWITAQVLERDGNNAELIAVASKILEIEPQFFLARRALARVYLRVGDLAECLGTVSPLVKEIDDPVGLEILARLQVELGRNQRALDVLRRLAAVRVCAAQRELADEALAKASKWAFDDDAFRTAVSDLRTRLAHGEEITPPSEANVDKVLDAQFVELSIELDTAVAG